MKKYEITATLWRVERTADGDEIDRVRVTEGVVTSTDDEDDAQKLFAFVTHQ